MTEEARAAQRAYSREYYRTHKEQIQAYNKKYREGHREKIAAYYREWRAVHPERQREYNNRYWEKKGKELESTGDINQ